MRSAHALYISLGKHHAHTSLQCITIKILDDEEFEGEKPESFSLSLSVYNIAVVVNTSSATVFIVDDESDGGTSVG